MVANLATEAFYLLICFSSDFFILIWNDLKSLHSCFWSWLYSLWGWSLYFWKIHPFLLSSDVRFIVREVKFWPLTAQAKSDSQLWLNLWQVELLTEGPLRVHFFQPLTILHKIILNTWEFRWDWRLWVVLDFSFCFRKVGFHRWGRDWWFIHQRIVHFRYRFDT